MGGAGRSAADAHRNPPLSLDPFEPHGGFMRRLWLMPERLPPQVAADAHLQRGGGWGAKDAELRARSQPAG